MTLASTTRGVDNNEHACSVILRITVDVFRYKLMEMVKSWDDLLTTHLRQSSGLLQCMPLTCTLQTYKL